MRAHDDAIGGPAFLQHRIGESMIVRLDPGVADIVVLEMQIETESFVDRFEHGNRGRDDFRSDAVAG